MLIVQRKSHRLKAFSYPSYFHRNPAFSKNNACKPGEARCNTNTLPVYITSITSSDTYSDQVRAFVSIQPFKSEGSRTNIRKFAPNTSLKTSNFPFSKRILHNQNTHRNELGWDRF